jgi:hypothetical protein
MGSRYVYRIASVADEDASHTTPAIYVPVTSASLGQNYPNPFNPVTSIDYYVPEGVRHEVSLIVYDVRGARVRTLVREALVSGKYTANWDGRNDTGQQVSSGVYFYRLVRGAFHSTRKMLLIK